MKNITLVLGILFLFACSKTEVPVERLMVGGVYQWKRKGEFHLFNPTTIHLLQYATKMNDYNTFKKCKYKF